MMWVMQILAALGVGLVIYAAFEIFRPQEVKSANKKKAADQLPAAEDSGREQKIQRLQNRIIDLEREIQKNQAEHAQGKAQILTAKENELKFFDELKRREDWVARAEAEVVKIESENSDLSAKFITKEKELEGEFAKNVNLSREIRELKSSLEAKEIACRLKEDQIQAQKRQIETQLETINEHLAAVAEFSRKEKISEWVPKAEFSKLNEEYSALEKELEETQGRLKSFAEEIARLRQEARQAEELKQAEEIKQAEEPKSTQEIKFPGEVKQEKADPAEEKIEQPVEENKPKGEEK